LYIKTREQKKLCPEMGIANYGFGGKGIDGILDDFESYS